MAIKYSCFISYPHPKQGTEFGKVIDQLEQALADQLGYNLDEPIYIDKNRLKPGYAYDEALAGAICQSACMIVLFTSLYQVRTYCLREFMAMEKLEEARIQKLKEKFDKTRRMIIPIVIRRDTDKDLPGKINKIQYWDLTKIMNRGFNLRNQECRKVIIDIANEILKHLCTLKLLEGTSLDDDCDSFKIPSEQEAMQSWSLEPLPRSSGFPLRGGT